MKTNKATIRSGNIGTVTISAATEQEVVCALVAMGITGPYKVESTRMTAEEAIREARATGHWFRPVAWNDSGIALCIEGIEVQLVPTARGGRRAMFPDVAEFLGGWEVVSPDEVAAE